MDDSLALTPLRMQAAEVIRALPRINEQTGFYGLVLSEAQAVRLTQRRLEALKATGRVEFGGGILPKLALVFCSSPYIDQHSYEDTLAQLQEIFYYFKNEAMESLPDDELLEAMKTIFDGKAQGSMEYLAETGLEELCRALRGGAEEDDIAEDE